MQIWQHDKGNSVISTCKGSGGVGNAPKGTWHS
jgi:hypothetical protein